MWCRLGVSKYKILLPILYLFQSKPKYIDTFNTWCKISFGGAIWLCNVATFSTVTRILPDETHYLTPQQKVTPKYIP
jgi:hypothetical protein